VKRIVWTEIARADVRRLDRDTAMRIFAALQRFAESGVGDVRALTGRDELRLRVGDYRVLFLTVGTDALEVRRVFHRSQAYR
jgi:mRNA interferase RelE/StbE